MTTEVKDKATISSIYTKKSIQEKLRVKLENIRLEIEQLKKLEEEIKNYLQIS